MPFDGSIVFVLEFSLLAALATPGIRAATSTAYRRVYPLDAIRIGAASVLYLAIVTLVALFVPRWLHVLAAGASGVGLWLVWRARPSYGASSGIPPGSLNPLPVQPWSDPDFYKQQAKRYGNVFKTSQFGQPMICVVGLERANRLLLEHDQQLVAPPLPFSRFIKGGYLRYLPEESHSNYRRFFHSLFHSEVVRNAEPRISAAFHRGLTAMCAESDRKVSVAVKPALMRMMFVAWADLFYGIDDEHPDYKRLKELFHVIDIRKARWASRSKVEAALAEIEEIIGRQAKVVAADDSSMCFLASLARNHPEALTDRTVLGNLIYIMQVSWGDVTGLLIWVFKMISDNQDWRKRLTDQPTRDLATRIVRETLRLEQSESRYRRAVADIELDGFRIPKNWLVRMCIRESHQDEATFPDPQSFNPDRFLGKTFTRAQYAPFGAFRLACIGEELTKAVGALFAIELVTNFQWTVASDGPAEISSWTHNAPSPRFSVSMSPRSIAH